MNEKVYDRDAATLEWIEKFKQNKAEIESKKETFHPVHFKLLCNSTDSMIADLEAQLARKCKIIINCKEHFCYDDEIGYQEIFKFAYGKWPTTPYEFEFSCAYSNPGKNNGGGIIGFFNPDKENEMVIPKEGMVFDIIHTG